MLNNTRICPNCRSTLATNTCKKCGYKQNILKVAEFQQDFGRRNYANKIQTSHRETKGIKSLNEQEKLAIYLKQYQKLIIKGVERIIEANQLNTELKCQLKKQVKYIWQKYLLNIKQGDPSLLGILKKPVNVQNFFKANYKKQQHELKQIKESDQVKQELQDVKQPQQSYKAKKRGRPSRFHSQQKRQIQNSTKLRCYFNVSVRPLIKESIQQRKNDSNELTHAQKSYLSFILSLRQIDQEFLGMSSNKYLKLLLQIDGNKVQKSFVKESLISNQLKKRTLQSQKDRSKSILLLLLYDIIICQTAGNLYQQNGNSLQQLISFYRKKQPNQAIDLMLMLLNKQKNRLVQTIPQISYELIYSIMFLATSKLGLTISIGEVITQIGSLEIARVNIQQDLSLPAILNQEVIISSKARRTAHLLAKCLNLSFPVLITKWCKKWCTKFDFLAELPLLSQLNRLFFKQVLKNGLRKRPNIQQSSKYHNYFRFCELQQDIATLGSLLVALKLADGLSDYPYLINIKTELLKKQYSFQEELLPLIEKLMKNKQISVQNTVTKQICIKNLPQIYRSPIDTLKFMRKVTQINQNDKYLGSKLNNQELVRLRNSSHINDIPSIKLLQLFKTIKQNKGQKQPQDQIKLRYNEVPHRQWTFQFAKLKKIKLHKVTKQHSKPKVELHEDLIKQMGCILSPQQVIVNQLSDKKQQCLVDDPSKNYQLMYEYSGDNLMLVQRCQQLYMMQQLCLNVCSYNELIVWIHSYESLLKKFET